MAIVRFYKPDFVPGGKLIYSVICARVCDKWIFVRHRDRTSWEIPGGHIEDGESPDEAAYRELKEETGARDFDLECVATYSVEKDGNMGYGRLYFAEVRQHGCLPDTSEIAMVMFSFHLPENLTYPDIQPLMFRRTIKYLKKKSKF